MPYFQVLQELIQISDQRLLEQQVSEYNQQISELWDKLMGYELQLVDQLEVDFFTGCRKTFKTGYL